MIQGKLYLTNFSGHALERIDFSGDVHWSPPPSQYLTNGSNRQGPFLLHCGEIFSLQVTYQMLSNTGISLGTFEVRAGTSKDGNGKTKVNFFEKAPAGADWQAAPDGRDLEIQIVGIPRDFTTFITFN